MIIETLFELIEFSEEIANSGEQNTDFKWIPLRKCNCKFLQAMENNNYE